MAGLGVLGFDCVDELASLLGRVRPGERRNKAGTLDLNLVGEECARGECAKNGHEASLGESSQLPVCNQDRRRVGSRDVLQGQVRGSLVGLSPCARVAHRTRIVVEKEEER